DLLTFDPNNLITQFGAINGTGGNILPYISGPGSVATTTVTPYARTLLDDANATAAQSTLGLTPGLLGASAPVPSAAGNGMVDEDFNTLTAYGVYTIGGSWANGPT